MGTFNAYMALSGAYDADVLRDERLSRRTSYRVGGPADLFVVVHTYEALVRTLGVLSREEVPWVVLGRGTNVLVADEGYRGCVIKLEGDFSRISFGEDGTVTAGAGAMLSRLVSQTLSHELSGLEPCVGIPGTVGGALAMNAGARREWIGACVSSLVTLRPGEGMHRWEGSDIDWGYRWTSLPTSEVILEATLQLESAPKKDIAQAMERRIVRRRMSQPVGAPSCGSVFKNPPDKSVGRLIDDCGLKGYAQGGACVSQEHANFIINTGGATAADILSVMSHVHDTVLDRTGIDLAPEVKYLGSGA